MTITIADGRGALWQWDTGRRLRVGSGVDQIHYQNRVLGRSVDVGVGADGTAIIPDELLQDWHTLTAYAYVTDDTGAYTMVQQDFAVHKRAKPAGYVYTPTDQMTLQTIQRQIGDLADLTTEAKDTLVAAINEVAQTGGGAGSVDLRVADGYVQYSRDGGKTWQNLIAVVDLKGDKGDPGADGVTPHIGDNGNWYLGTTDTGKPSRGEQGPDAEVYYVDLAGTYPSYTCATAMADIAAAYASGKELKCRFAMGMYTAVMPLLMPMPGANTWIFSGAGALAEMSFPAQSITIAIANGTVQASDTLLASMDDIPTALKNPNALTIKIGGTTVTYDGSEAKIVEIADGTEVAY